MAEITPRSEGGVANIIKKRLFDAFYKIHITLILHHKCRSVLRTTTITAETKERAVKPVATASISAGLWKNKGVIGLSVSISAEGLVFYQETESGYKSCLSMVGKGQSVEVKCMERGSETPYLTGKFVIASLERGDTAQDDATYSISLENDGEVEFDEDAITETTEA